MTERTYRVEEAAVAGGVSVEVLRAYQSKGLVPAPRHVGRMAVYDDRHLDRLRTIRDLKARGYSLKVIARIIDRGVGPVDDDASAFAEAETDDELIDLREVARRSGVPTAMLRSLESSGVLRPRRVGDELRYTNADVHAVRMLMSLIGTGLPMEEFMRVARRQLEAASEVAGGAVELFLRYSRDPLRAAGLSEREEADQLVASFRLMVHAATSLMTYNFQRMLLNGVLEAIDRDGSRAERAALRREARRRLDAARPA
jgi:DNA-binding transcriptional MerR regulator